MTLDTEPSSKSLTAFSKSIIIPLATFKQALMSFALIPLASTIPSNNPSNIIPITSSSKITASIFLVSLSS